MRSSIIALLLAASPIGPAALAADNPPSQKQIISLDERALWAKKSGVQTFTIALKTRMNTAQEPVLQLRIAEIYQDMAAIQYRLAYAKAANNSAAKLDDYYNTLKASLASLNRIITVYPKWDNISRAFYLRSKVFAETDRSDAAVADLKHLVEVYPTSKDSGVGNMDLWRLLISRKEYTTAIQYINHYGLRPGDKYYDAALEKLSLCYFYLGDMPNAIRYSEIEIKSARGVDREKALSNYALFYVTCVDRKTPNFDANGAYDHFKALVSGEDLGKLGVSYAYLLRTKGLDHELDAFKNEVANESFPELYKNDVFLVALEDEFNKHNFDLMKDSALKEIALYTTSKAIKKDSRRVAKIKGIFKDMIIGLQKTLVDNATSVDASNKASETLGFCYQFMLDTSEHDIAEQGRIHLNMALLSFQLKKYEDSVKHNRWVVDHLDFKDKEQSALYISASTKAIEARYETLKDNNWVPKNLVAKPLNTAKTDIPEQATEWIKWVDAFPQVAFLENKMDAQSFEASRIIYSYGHVEESTERMQKFVKHYPTSSFAPTAASLILDTYIASEKWEDAYSIALDYSKITTWQDPKFRERVTDLGSDIYCKVLDIYYKDKKYEKTISNSENYIKEYPNTKRKADILELAANAALAIGDKLKAASIFNQLQASGKARPAVQILSYMTQGSISEDQFDFRTAAQHYRNAAELSPTATEEMRNKVLLFSWLAGDPQELDAALGSTRVCPSPRDQLCTSYERRFEETYENSPKHSEPWVRTPIAKLALKERLSTVDRAEMLASIPKEWDKLNSLDRSAVLPMLLYRVPEAFQASRSQVRKYSSLSLEPKSIAKRAKLVSTLQTSAEKITQLPWTRIRLNVIRETAGLYDDAAEDLLGIRPPADVKGKDREDFKNVLAEAAAPFKQKSEELHKAEQDISSQKGEQATPAEARRWVAVLHGMIPKGGSATLVSRFKEAIDKSNWQLAGFLIERAQEMSQANVKETKVEPFPPETLILMRASLLASSGATSEALEELKTLPVNMKDSVDTKLASLRQPSARVPASSPKTPAPSASPSAKAGGTKP